MEASVRRYGVRVKPGAKEEKVERVDDAHFRIAVKAPPREGKANEAVCAALAGFFGVPRSHIRIVSGHTSREKIIEILSDM